jgi:hypothetical protein
MKNSICLFNMHLEEKYGSQITLISLNSHLFLKELISTLMPCSYT